MKPFAFAFAALLALTSVAVAGDLESRIAELEKRNRELETALSKKLETCTLQYKHHAYSLNVCPELTVVHGITTLTDKTVQLDCGYYQLQCKRDPNQAIE
jgi:deoxyadenosine/deoxycytidine kinase